MIGTPDINQYLETYQRESHGLYGAMPTMYTRLLEHGKAFAPAPKPKGVHQGVRKQCFFNAFRLATEAGLIYCEGLAMIPSIIPVHHAWCVDEEGKLIDNTWMGPGSEYRGVMFNTDYLEDAAFHSGVYGIMDNFCFRRFYDDKPEQFLYQGETTHV